METTDGDLQQLPQMIVSWKQTQDECKRLKQQLRENNTREKAYREVIMRVMKKNGIGTLDLKQSQNRVLYQTKQKKASLGKKNLQGLVTEYMNSEEDAKKLLDYIAEKQGTTSVEKLVLEKL
jgi:hypothetical protein